MPWWIHFPNCCNAITAPWFKFVAETIRTVVAESVAITTDLYPGGEATMGDPRDEDAAAHSHCH
jgi:hypothetical protein